MGTSLGNLSPGSTYPGLLKFGDNASIGSSLKTISDGEGNDTMLEISTTALQVGGGTGMYWDNTNKRLGIGTTGPQSILDLQNVSGGAVLNLQSNSFAFMSVKRFQNSSTRPRYELLKSRGTIDTPLVIQTGDELGSIEFNGFDGTSFQRNAIIYVTAQNVTGSTITPQMAFGLGQSGNLNQYLMNIQNNGNVSIGNGLSDLGSRFGIKGRGTTGGISLLVQNSSGAERLKVLDNGTITMPGLPTSPTGLTGGALWNDGGTLKIV
jgi:hypothetical protein